MLFTVCVFFVYSGTVEDTELVDGLVLDQKASHFAGGITRVEKAKVGLIQFCISPPKTDVSSDVSCTCLVELINSLCSMCGKKYVLF